MFKSIDITAVSYTHLDVYKRQIVYTPLHGTGNLPVRRVLKELGFEHVYVVPEQEKPDGNFPTVAYPVSYTHLNS